MSDAEVKREIGQDITLKEKYQADAVHHSTAIEAKLAVMRAVGYCHTRRSDGLTYAYIGESNLIGVMRPAMIRNGIAVAPVQAEFIETTPFETRKGSLQFRSTVKVTYRFTYSLKQADQLVSEHEDIEVIGSGSDTFDKGLGKAMTSAFKYALRQWGMMESGEDPDAFASQEVVRSQHDTQEELRKSFLKCLEAIQKAPSAAKLQQYRKVYLDREYTDEQKDDLEDAYRTKSKELGA